MTERDIYEVANQLLGYVGPDTPEPLAKFLIREGEAASELANTIVRLRARLETVEAETRERCAKVADAAGDDFDNASPEGNARNGHAHRIAHRIRNLEPQEGSEPS